MTEQEAAISVDKIVQLVSQALQSSCSLSSTPCHNPMEGGANFMWIFDMPQKGNRVCMRLSRSWRFEHYRSSILQEYKSEAKHLAAIRYAGIEGFPRLLAYDLSPFNEIQQPYLLLDWCDGVSLQWTETLPSERSIRDKIVRSVADLCLKLFKVQESIEIDTKHFVHNQLTRRLRNIDVQDRSQSATSSYARHLSFLDMYVLPDMNPCCLVLTQGDMSANNVIVDDGHNVVRIVDFNLAEMVPLQFAACYPRFLTHEPQKVNGYYDWSSCDNATISLDRQVFRDHLALRAEEGNILADSFHEIVSRKDEIDRYWWFMALKYRNIYDAMVECDWRPPIKHR